MDKTQTYERVAARFAKSAKSGHGVFKLINKNALYVDSEYQRGAKSFIDYYAKNWWWACVGTISVCERSDGTFAVFDGKQRTLAARARKDITELPCMVYKLSSVEEEAAAFLGVQANRKAVSALEKFNGLVTTKDDASKFLKIVIEKSGYKVQHSSANWSMACVSAALRSLEYGKDIFKIAFPVIADIHGGYPIDARIMLGITYLFKHASGEVSTKFAINRLVKIGHKELGDSISSTVLLVGRRNTPAYAKGIVDRFNKSLRTGNRITIFDLPLDD